MHHVSGGRTISSGGAGGNSNHKYREVGNQPSIFQEHQKDKCGSGKEEEVKLEIIGEREK